MNSWAGPDPPRVVQDGLRVGDAVAFEEDDDVRTGYGKPLLIAAGGGGGYASPKSGQSGPDGGERGQDGTKPEHGGKGGRSHRRRGRRQRLLRPPTRPREARTVRAVPVRAKAAVARTKTGAWPAAARAAAVMSTRTG